MLTIVILIIISIKGLRSVLKYLKLPRVQYSLTIRICSGSTHAPMNEFRLSCRRSFITCIQIPIISHFKMKSSYYLKYNNIHSILIAKSMNTFSSFLMFRVISIICDPKQSLTANILPLYNPTYNSNLVVRC